MKKGESVNFLNILAMVATVVVGLLFLVLLWQTLNYLRVVTARIIYIVRIASKRSYQKLRKREAQESHSSVETEDQFYTDLKVDFTRQVLQDRAGICCRMLCSKMLKYNYHVVACFRVKTGLSDYDLLRPPKNFRCLLLLTQLFILWFVTVFSVTLLHTFSDHSASNDILESPFLIYLLVICAFSTPTILFSIWALWRHYLKTIAHALITGNKLSQVQREQEFIIDNLEDSLGEMNDYLPQSPQDIQIQQQPYSDSSDIRPENLRHSFQPPPLYESGGPESDRNLVDRPIAHTFHLSAGKGLSKIDEEAVGPFALDGRTIPQDLSPRDPRYLSTSKQGGFGAQNISHLSSSREPVRYSTILKPKGASVTSVYINDPNPSQKEVSTRENRVLWNMPVPRIRGKLSRLASYITGPDGLWYGIISIILLLFGVLACVQLSGFGLFMAVNALLLFVAAIIVEILIVRNFALVFVTAVHHCCYTRRRQRAEGLYMLKFAERAYNSLPIESEDDERAKLRKPRGVDDWEPCGDQKRRAWVTAPTQMPQQLKDAKEVPLPALENYSPIRHVDSAHRRSSPLRMSDFMEQGPKKTLSQSYDGIPEEDAKNIEKRGGGSQRYDQKQLEEYDRKSPGKKVSFIDPNDGQAPQAGSVQPIPKPQSREGSIAQEPIDYEEERVGSGLGHQSPIRPEAMESGESLDRRSSLAIPEMFAVENPVSELHDLNLMLLDQIRDAFDDKVQDMVKGFRGRNFFLPYEEDDLCEVDELPPPEPEVRIYQEEDPTPVPATLLEDGTEELEILKQVGFYPHADPELVDVVSPFHNFFNNRPLSSASQRANIRATEPEYQSAASDTPPKPYILVSDTEDEGVAVLNLSNDPFESSHDTRFAGENKPLPEYLLRRKKPDEMEEGSELDPYSVPRQSSELGGSMEIISARRSKPLGEVRHKVLGPKGMQDAGGLPISVYLQNQELPLEEGDLDTESSVFGPAKMLDDAALKKRRVKFPKLLELKERGREVEPLGGMATDRGKDELEQTFKIHDERRMLAEQIDNELEEDYHLDENAVSPYAELQQNFPTPVPKENIKHRRSHTREFSRSKSPPRFYPPKLDEEVGGGNSSIIEQENVHFEHSLYETGRSPIQDLQGQERTRYSRGYDTGGRDFPPRGTDSHFFSKPLSQFNRYPAELESGGHPHKDLRGGIQLLSRPGQDRMGSPYITSDSDSLAFRRIQQPASATKSDFNEEYQRGRAMRRTYGSDDSHKEGHVSEAFYRPPEGPVTGQLFTKTKRTGGGFEYGTYFRASSQGDPRFGEGMMPSNLARRPMSLSPPPLITEPKRPEARHSHKPPLVETPTGTVENWKKMGRKTSKKPYKGPYADVSAAVNFMNKHYPGELKRGEDEVTTPGSYEPRFPVGERGAMKEIIHRAPQVLSQVKRKKRSQKVS